MPDALDARLNAETARLIGRPLGQGDRFGLAVSGGADSMAMLALAAQCWPGRIEAATVDHGLRVEARAEAQMVADWCAAHDVPHALLSVADPIRRNIQAEARAARYALLEKWRGAHELNWLLTAHQADDQIETLILRLNRGSGVGGLAGVRARRGHILRPMLVFRRTELRAFCEDQGIPFVDDPSNIDDQFDRVRLRKVLAGRDLFNPDGVARALEAVADAAQALDWMTDTLDAELVREEQGAFVLARTDLPRELLRRLLLRMIARANPQGEPPRGPSFDQALVQLFDGKRVALADCIVAGGAKWAVRRAPPRR